MNYSEYTKLLTKLRAIEKITEATAPDDLTSLADFVKNIFCSDIYFFIDNQKFRCDEIADYFTDPDYLRLGIAYDSKELKVSLTESISNQLIKSKSLYITTIPLLKGHLIVEHKENLNDKDLIVAECTAALISRKLNYLLTVPPATKIYDEICIQTVLSTLSFKELSGTFYLFNALEKQKGCIQTSKIARQAGISQHVITEILKKLKASSMIDFRTHGPKGTYIQILNRDLKDEVQKRYLKKLPQKTKPKRNP